VGDSDVYLAGLPESEQAARRLLAWGETHVEELSNSERPKLGAVRLHEPIEVAALFDFGLTPRHLKNSGATIMKYEKDNPQTSAMLQAFAKAVMAPKSRPPAGQPEPLSYYKCNMDTIVDDRVTIPWPPYENYQRDLRQIKYPLATIIVSCSQEYNANRLADEKASALLDRHLGIEEAEIKLKRAFAPRRANLLPGRKVSRYLRARIIDDEGRYVHESEVRADVGGTFSSGLALPAEVAAQTADA